MIESLNVQHIPHYHELKISPDMFLSIYLNTCRNFEINPNDEKFKYGDVIVFKEFYTHTNLYTGRDITRIISNIEYLPNGNVFFSITTVNKFARRKNVESCSECIHFRDDYDFEIFYCNKTKNNVDKNIVECDNFVRRCK